MTIMHTASATFILLINNILFMTVCNAWHHLHLKQRGACIALNLSDWKKKIYLLMKCEVFLSNFSEFTFKIEFQDNLLEIRIYRIFFLPSHSGCLMCYF